MRVMVKVPEGYLLLKPMDTSRPALFVMDHEGNRVTSISLELALDGALDPKELAKQITEAKSSAAMTRHVFEGDPEQIKALQKALEGKAKSIQAAAFKTTVAPGDDGRERLEFRTPSERGFLARALPNAKKLDVCLIEPVHVVIRVETPVKANLDRFYAPILLHPKTLAVENDPSGKSVWKKSDLVRHKFEFPELPKGATALGIFRLPMPMKGVLAVHPDLSNNAITVVGRRDQIDFEAIGKAFAAAGHEPFEEVKAAK